MVFMVLFWFLYLFQNAGAVIGKGGKNIKALRTDVSIKEFKRLLRQLQFMCLYKIKDAS